MFVYIHLYCVRLLLWDISYFHLIFSLSTRINCPMVLPNEALCSFLSVSLAYSLSEASGGEKCGEIRLLSVAVSAISCCCCRLSEPETKKKI